MTSAADILLFKTQVEWHDWLAENYALSKGVSLQFAKKGSEIQTLSYAEALDTALCFGWIDAVKNKGPNGTWVQRFTPRGQRSIWSKINRAKAMALIEAGRMRPSGLAAIERAKTNGQWDAAYDAVSVSTVPPDLARELAADNPAKDFFEILSSQNRYAILFRLQTAKRPETRAKRLATFMQMLRQRETIYPQKHR